MKTRHQSKLDFLEKLQEEYYTHFLRAAIYPAPNDKRYHRKVMEYKKQKIHDLSANYELPNIFNDTTIQETVKATIIPASGLPTFEGVTEKDLINYFAVGTSVLYKGENKEKKTGVIVENNREKGVALVKMRNSENKKPCLYKSLTRIL